MTPKERAAMQQALEALEELHHSNSTKVAVEKYYNATTALREALAEQAEQEPVAWCYFCEDALWGFFTDHDECDPDCDNEMPLYAAPVRTKEPCNPLQDLTDDEIISALGADMDTDEDKECFIEIVRLGIAAYKEKNK